MFSKCKNKLHCVFFMYLYDYNYYKLFIFLFLHQIYTISSQSVDCFKFDSMS